MAQSSEFSFEEKLRHYSTYVQQHEDVIAQTMALSLAPIDDLNKQASELTEWLFDDEIRIVQPLIRWFKNSFFHWVDNPDCSSCKAPTTESFQPPANDMSRPTPEEKNKSASRIELYKCAVCARIERFARYNSPEVLLETRQGRCGEWANCFYLFLRALGLQARYVVDWTDHVWCEVYSKSTRQWVHLDPCEGAIDKPLIYEVGWGKKLSYVIGFSNIDVTDVTWRYVRFRKEISKRRYEISEKGLIQVLKRVNSSLQESLTVDEKNDLAQRKLWELADMFSPRKESDAEKIGRQSGGAEWRMLRGEATASQITSKAEQETGVSICPTDKEIESKLLILSYNSALDKYDRGQSSIEGWKSLVWKSVNVFRKVERDWKMAYLCRNEHSLPSEPGEISWLIDLKDCSSNVSIDSVEIAVSSEKFAATTSMNLKISELDGKTPFFECALPRGEPVKLERTSHFRPDLRHVLIKISMEGGSGPLAWQHLQISRQSLVMDRDKSGIEVNIHFCV